MSWTTSRPLLLVLLGLMAGPAAASDHAGGAWKNVDLPEASERFSSGSDAAVSDSPWWQSFGEPELDALVDEGLASSPDLAGAWDRVRQSDALSQTGAAAFLPNVSADGSVSFAPTENLGFGFGLPNQFEQEVYSQGKVGVNAAMNLDLFGRNITSWRAGRLDAMAAAGDKDAVALALTTRIVQAWLDLVAAREQVAMIEEQIAANEALLELTELRYQASGDATGLDVLQQRQQLESTRVRLPQAQLSEALASQQLAVLLGRRAWTSAPSTPAALPGLPAKPAVGTPADLVDHRPDLRAAADRLDAASMRKTSAMLAVMPSLGVSAGAGQQFIDTGDITWQDYWNVGLSVSVPLFNGGAAYNGFKAAKAEESSAARTFESTLLGAIQEVEGAMQQEARMADVLAANEAQLAAAQAAFENARDRYGQGLVTYQQVLTSLSAWQNAQQSELSARRSLLDARIALHQSLGGAWTRQASPSGADR